MQETTETSSPQENTSKEVSKAHSPKPIDLSRTLDHKNTANNNTNNNNITTNSVFMQKHPFLKRQAESARVRVKYPDRCPVIIERATFVKGNEIAEIERIKFLIPSDLTMGQVTHIIRKRIRLASSHAIFVYVNSRHLAPTSKLICEVYKESVDADGFLYLSYTGEAVYG